MKTKSILISASFLSLLFLTGCKQEGVANQSNSTKDLSNGGTTTIEAKPLTYKKEKQLELGNLDLLSRATNAHIQVSKNQLPTQKRASRLSYNPTGWHNYKIKTTGKNFYWGYNRGHLVGYQFSGLNDNPKNLVTQTRILNAGKGRGTDEKNPLSQLYYEQKLRKFVENNPDKKLDYQVTPLYKDKELMPRAVRLSFVAYNKNGKLEKIKLDSNNKYVKYKGKLGVVSLPNTDSNLKINYQTGKAVIVGHKNH